MPAAVQFERQPIVDHWSAPALLARDLGQAGEHVGQRQCISTALERGQRIGSTLAQGREQRQLLGADAVLGAQRLVLVLLQLGRDVALGADQRLLADEVRRHLVAVGLADLDVVAEDLVVADLQLGQATALGFTRLIGRKPRAGVGPDHAQLIQFGVDTVAHHAAFTDRERRIIDQRALDIGDQFGCGVESVQCLGEQRRCLTAPQRHPHLFRRTQ